MHIRVLLGRLMPPLMPPNQLNTPIVDTRVTTDHVNPRPGAGVTAAPSPASPPANDPNPLDGHAGPAATQNPEGSVRLSGLFSK
jgi:hypothetical protein